MKRKVVLKNRKKNQTIIALIAGIVLFLGIGYSSLGLDLDFSGTLDVGKWVDPVLYNVLKREAESGNGLAEEYTGPHNDTINGSGSEKIYYWSADTEEEANQINNKNNVLYRNICWQIVRTTDSGGVKLIYNGEAEKNQCLPNRGNQLGYGSRTFYNMGDFYYSNKYNYDSDSNLFTLNSPNQTTWNETNADDLIGYYTCLSTDPDETCSTLYMVDGYRNYMSAFLIPIEKNSPYYQIGILPYNSSADSLAYSGYMYNDVYPTQSMVMTSTEDVLYSNALRTTYWYANSATWNTPTANRWNLDSPFQVTAAEYPNLVGTYTIPSTSQTGTSSSVRYIAGVASSTYFYINLSGNTSLSAQNASYTYGSSYIDNGNGTYTINGPTTYQRTDWFNHYTEFEGKYVCKNAVNNTCSDAMYVITSSPTNFTYISLNNKYMYSSSFTWDGTSYTLDSSGAVSFWNIGDSTNQSALSGAHYTCFNASGTCTNLYYIYYVASNTPYYITLSGGENASTAFQSMTNVNSINVYDSTIKRGIEAWVKDWETGFYFMLDYNAVFCNNREVVSSGGWNPVSGDVTQHLEFHDSTNSTDLSCSQVTDQFSVNNPRARLLLPVGLLSGAEMNLIQPKYLKKTGQNYWSMSPATFLSTNGATAKNINTTGDAESQLVSNSYGVRPVIVMKKGTEIASGGGTMTNPYRIYEPPQ